MTHAKLVEIAERWLRGTRNCGVVLCGKPGGVEIPDAIGFSRHTIVVEVKVSRADFFADRKKPMRQHDSIALGAERWYLTPLGLVGSHEVPNPWGLLSWTGRIVRRVKPPVVDVETEYSIRRTRAMVLAELRKFHVQGITYAPVTDARVVPQQPIGQSDRDVHADA